MPWRRFVLRRWHLLRTERRYMLFYIHYRRRRSNILFKSLFPTAALYRFYIMSIQLLRHDFRCTSCTSQRPPPSQRRCGCRPHNPAHACPPSLWTSFTSTKPFLSATLSISEITSCPSWGYKLCKIPICYKIQMASSWNARRTPICASPSCSMEWEKWSIYKCFCYPMSCFLSTSSHTRRPPCSMQAPKSRSSPAVFYYMYMLFYKIYTIWSKRPASFQAAAAEYVCVYQEYAQKIPLFLAVVLQATAFKTILCYKMPHNATRTREAYARGPTQSTYNYGIKTSLHFWKCPACKDKWLYRGLLPPISSTVYGSPTYLWKYLQTKYTTEATADGTSFHRIRPPIYIWSLFWNGRSTKTHTVYLQSFTISMLLQKGTLASQRPKRLSKRGSKQSSRWETPISDLQMPYIVQVFFHMYALSRTPIFVLQSQFPVGRVLWLYKVFVFWPRYTYLPLYVQMATTTVGSYKHQAMSQKIYILLYILATTLQKPRGEAICGTDLLASGSLAYPTCLHLYKYNLVHPRPLPWMWLFMRLYTTVPCGDLYNLQRKKEAIPVFRDQRPQRACCNLSYGFAVVFYFPLGKNAWHRQRRECYRGKAGGNYGWRRYKAFEMDISQPSCPPQPPQILQGKTNVLYPLHPIYIHVQHYVGNLLFYICIYYTIYKKLFFGQKPFNCSYYMQEVPFNTFWIYRPRSVFGIQLPGKCTKKFYQNTRPHETPLYPKVCPCTTTFTSLYYARYLRCLCYVGKRAYPLAPITVILPLERVPKKRLYETLRKRVLRTARRVFC
uniref:PF778R n=1 Tax=African swine fever virus TaxID=10497 RepID=A0A6G7KTQ2_ASF